MSETNGNGEERATTSSGGPPSKFKGKPASDTPLVLGALECFGKLVYKHNTNDQVEMYNRTTAYLIVYVTKEYGSDMKNLVKYREEKDFPEPKPPVTASDKKDQVKLARYKEKLSSNTRDKKEYIDRKAKVFAVILGQCTREMISRLEANPSFADIEKTDDVIGLLDMLKATSHSKADVQEPYWALQQDVRRLTALNQGKHETVANYYNKFRYQADVIAGQWGLFYPPLLAASDSDEDTKASNEKLLTMIFLAGSCKHRYGNLKMQLNNAYLAGKDNYPATLQAAFNLLSHYQDHRDQNDGYHGKGDKDSRRATSFLQKTKKDKKKDRADRSPPPTQDNRGRSSSRERRNSRAQDEGWSGS